jgi:ribonuclease HI
MKESKKSSIKKKIKFKKRYKSEIRIFTDGSCMKGSEMKCGYGVHFENISLDDISKKFTHKPLTNQRAELYAIYRGIGSVIRHYKFDKLMVYTDSAYSIGCLTMWKDSWKKNGWKTSGKKDVLNQDIIKKILKYTESEKFVDKIEFEHVKAHTGKSDKKSIGNAVADKLATDGASS